MEERFENRMEERAARRPRRGGIVWPLILIGAGIVFLLNNAGVLNWNIWWTLAQLWPVILIAVGLDILIGRRSILGSLLVIVVTVAIVAAAFVYWSPAISAAGRNLTTQQISQGLEGATQAAVDISAGTANLTIKDGAEGTGLVQGAVMLASDERLSSPTFTRSGDSANFRLHTQGASRVWPAGFRDAGLGAKRWDLQFNPDVPMALRVDAGVGSTNLDLSRLKITSLNANAGVGSVEVTLPRSGKLTANLDAGVGKVHIVIPAGMAVHVRLDRGLGGVDVNGNLQRQGDNDYVSPGFDSASDRVDMKINGGVGHITIDQQAGG